VTDVDESNHTASEHAAAATGVDPTKIKSLRTCFTQPGVMPDFLDKVKQRKVTREK